MEHPASRRTVVVLDPETRLRAKRNPALVIDLLEDPETKIISTTEESPLATLIDGLGLLRAGVIAVQSPYDVNKYESNEFAPSQFTLAKFGILCDVAKALGATRVAVEQGHNTKDTSKVTASVKANYMKVGGEADLSRSAMNAASLEIEKSITFPGGPADPEAALQIMQDSHVMGDAELLNLVRARSGTNQAHRYSVCVSTLQETQRALSATAGITAGLKKLGVSVNTAVNMDKVSMDSVTLKTTVDFPTRLSRSTG